MNECMHRRLHYRDLVVKSRRKTKREARTKDTNTYRLTDPPATGLRPLPRRGWKINRFRSTVKLALAQKGSTWQATDHGPRGSKGRAEEDQSGRIRPCISSAAVTDITQSRSTIEKREEDEALGGGEHGEHRWFQAFRVQVAQSQGKQKTSFFISASFLRVMVHVKQLEHIERPMTKHVPGLASTKSNYREAGISLRPVLQTARVLGSPRGTRTRRDEGSCITLRLAHLIGWMSCWKRSEEKATWRINIFYKVSMLSLSGESPEPDTYQVHAVLVVLGSLTCSFPPWVYMDTQWQKNIRKAQPDTSFNRLERQGDDPVCL
ncbi:hypothetical protein SODALDRAFT_376184 [Sodiomyces alkalinus F11]|uniref:Uncharacterized protein n=1 Tax=Sodiomyces alkalinus (strain CBS 110278 / VKM F-3762 / F11) TaxID=1314773 RepID=A0A3N2Q0U7_SODAK|nr:hypothetical protein SODALDRAFT_376184 [Sodiomyces alkalinus F11]ROT40394.1 hypothetical protein SODALDRAFT_376184 [Sodiomyces alkalinus F11]